MEFNDKYLFVFVIVVVLGIAVGFFVWDRLYLKRRTKDVLSKTVKIELEEEREDNKRKKELFEKTLEKAKSSYKL